MGYLYFILFISFILLNLKTSSKISTNNFSEVVITAFILYACSITLSGYSLSFINQWNSPILWGLLPFLFTYLIFIFFKNFQFIENRRSTFKLIGSNIQKISEEVQNSSLFQKRFFQLLFTFNFIVICCILIVYLVSPPNEWDSMTGHLNRILYFLQNKNLNHFIGTNWNIDTYPKSFPNHQVYPFLMTSKNEIWFKFHNLSSFLIAGFAFYAIMKRIKFEFKTRLILSSFYLLIPISIIQSTTTDTDIVLASYLSVFVYFLISYFDQFEKRYILLGALTFSIALAHKITFVFSIPPIILLLVYFIWKKREEKPLRHFRYILSCYLLSILFIVAPCGYISNILHYGHPIGPKTATLHQSIERAGSFSNLMVQGSRNFIRYNFDILNPDGLRNLTYFEDINQKIKIPLKFIDQKLNLKLESETDFTIVPFYFNRSYLFFNSTPIIGFLILIIIGSIFLIPFEKNKDLKQLTVILLLSYVLHLLALSFTAAYDPWKGRYMQSSFVFLLPISGLLIQRLINAKKNLAKTISIIFIFFVGISGILTILLHQRALLLNSQNQKSIFKINRIEALTISRPDITKAYRNFDLIVPEDAIVAVATINDDFEYPLWGKKFNRKLIPINPFGKGLQIIPENCQYLFFAKSLISPQSGDINLAPRNNYDKNKVLIPGEDYFLRKLH